ncbi:MAG: putative pyridine nucleotide transhydrogenase [Streblomastix strix]|uniref:proton-translocating NAD(P)(+) transhydrogenase n=1 Tax=Streblomastix strix TaxID=222440 RepID=A0A5J4X2R3_9EUKA|nr:MAG: putative pyridine nucleotide transhydrogenase [Streblomastix strix]
MISSGTVIGTYIALCLVKTSIPELIAFFHSFAGLVATLIGFENFRHMINASILDISAISMVCYTVDMGFTLDFVQLSLGATLSGLLGVHLIMTNGGADISIVISMLNSYSGCATAESGFMLSNLSLLFSVLGYGMAAGKAQHAVAAITKLLRKHGCNFRVAVNQVAGRLSGHMNVILGGALAPYDIVLEIDEINKDFRATDVSIVL